MSEVSCVDAFQALKEAPHVASSALLADSRDAATSPDPALLPKDGPRLPRVRGRALYAIHLAADQLLARMAAAAAAGYFEYPVDYLLLSNYGAARLITATRTCSVRSIQSLLRLSANTRAAFKALPAPANRTARRGQGGPVRSPCPRE